LSGQHVSTLQGHHQALQEDRSKSCIMFSCIMGSHNAGKHNTALGYVFLDPTVQENIIQLLDLSSWRAWWWPYKVETCCPDKYTILLYINKVLCYRLTCCIYRICNTYCFIHDTNEFHSDMRTVPVLLLLAYQN